jgi:hypothetical protein
MPSHNIDIQYPGTFLDLPDTKIADDVYLLISTMNSQLTDASLVLSCYEKEKRRWMKVIRAQPEAYLTKIHHYSQFFHIYANYFVYALAIFGNCLNAIDRDYDLPPSIRQIRNDYKRQLPTLWNVRNSLMHVEDRVRALSRPKEGGKTRMRPQDHLLVLGSIMIDKDALCCTAADGSLQQIRVRKETLKVAEDALQKLINSLPWRGHPHGYLTDKALRKLGRVFMSIEKEMKPEG